jgi:hypothetical protein
MLRRRCEAVITGSVREEGSTFVLAYAAGGYCLTARTAYATLMGAELIARSRSFLEALDEFHSPLHCFVGRF